MIGHYSLSYWGSSNIFWAFKQAEYANALRNFIWIFFTLHDTNLFSNRPTNKESDIVLYMERKKKKKKKENLRVMTSQQQCREQLVRYWKLWSVWFQKKYKPYENEKCTMGSNYVHEYFRCPMTSRWNVCEQEVVIQSFQEDKWTGWFYMRRKKLSTHSWTLLSSQYIMLAPLYNPDQSWALRCAVLIFLFVKLSCIKELNPSLEYTRKICCYKKESKIDRKKWVVSASQYTNYNCK